MEKNLINPWQWQDNFGYSQAVEVKNNSSTLYCSGQAAMDTNGAAVSGNMQQQIQLSLANIAKLVTEAGYELSNIVRMNFHTTSIPDFFAAYNIILEWLKANSCKPASTLTEVKALAFPELLVEIEITAVR